MKQKVRNIKRVVGALSIALSMVIMAIPRFSQAEENTVPLTVKNYYKDISAVSATAIYIKDSGQNEPTFIQIEKYERKDTYTYGRAYYENKKNYKEAMFLYIWANNFKGKGKVTFQLPASWTIQYESATNGKTEVVRTAGSLYVARPSNELNAHSVSGVLTGKDSDTRIQLTVDWDTTEKDSYDVLIIAEKDESMAPAPTPDKPTPDKTAPDKPDPEPVLYPDPTPDPDVPETIVWDYTHPETGSAIYYYPNNYYDYDPVKEIYPNIGRRFPIPWPRIHGLMHGRVYAHSHGMTNGHHLVARGSSGNILRNKYPTGNGTSLEVFCLSLRDSDGKPIKTISDPVTISIALPDDFDPDKTNVQAVYARYDGTTGTYPTTVFIGGDGKYYARFDAIDHNKEYGLLYTTKVQDSDIIPYNPEDDNSYDPIYPVRPNIGSLIPSSCPRIHGLMHGRVYAHSNGMFNCHHVVVSDIAGTTLRLFYPAGQKTSLEVFGLSLRDVNGAAITTISDPVTISVALPAGFDPSKTSVQAVYAKAGGNTGSIPTEVITGDDGKLYAHFTVYDHNKEYGLLYTSKNVSDGGSSNSNPDNGNGNSDTNSGKQNSEDSSNDDSGSGNGQANNGNGSGTTGGSGNGNGGGNGSGNGNGRGNGSGNGGAGNGSGSASGTGLDSSSSTGGSSSASGSGASGSGSSSSGGSSTSISGGGSGNSTDMPKTGDNDIVRFLLAAFFFLFGCVELVTSMSVMKKKVVTIQNH